MDGGCTWSELSGSLQQSPPDKRSSFFFSFSSSPSSARRAGMEYKGGGGWETGECGFLPGPEQYGRGRGARKGVC